MNDWMNHPGLKDMDPVKMALIKKAAAQTAGKSGRDMVPIMMALITGANRKGIQFTPEEISLILDIIKEGKSPEEKAQIDQTIQFALSMMHRKK